ncbi:PepSY-associated TM helix domain-containing protein [Nonlabens antarcticus]|uniref:PepSY-associated TM helix domain-containing protein n=1 Tax=Nonlabens antarcticus TaxID=392714 RepID=UPI001890F9B5|nr:PepSY-associated TM helix domain-containing protein [Nonlabens antarcticus]
MTEKNKRKKQAKVLRVSRKIHRTMGAFLFVFFLFISVTGLLLGWKKHTGNLILPKSQSGLSTDLKEWLTVDSLHTIAVNVLRDSVSPDLSTKIDRIDIRKEKGMVKFVFEDHYWGIQLDGSTGELLHLEERRADLIENIHDGSILDKIFDTSNEPFKVIYTSIMGLSLLMFTVTGFWLWYGPKRMRKSKK